MDKEKLTEWLDKVIEAKKKLDAIHCYSEAIYTCDVWWGNELHLGEGIETVARVLGKVITYNPNWNEEHGEAFFYYGKYKIFALWKKGA